MFYAPEVVHGGLRTYQPVLTAVENQKGVLDVDTVKGCAAGMAAYPETGCYGECYANKTAKRYGIDFTVAVSRKLTPWTRIDVFQKVRDYYASWYRIGTAGDPCHDWDNTLEVCEYLQPTGKTPIIITKHWTPLSDSHLVRLKRVGAIVNTSLSGLDTDPQIKFRVKQMQRLEVAGIRSICRVVTCEYGDSEWAKAAKAKQDYLLTLTPVIDNPLRASRQNPKVMI
jgi:DNA-binding transcriptional ArsR family regulator